MAARAQDASQASSHSAPQQAYVIGVDIGTQSTKALLCDATGRIVAQYSRGYQPDTPQPMWAEQWPEVWLEATLACIEGCVKQAAASESGFTAASVHAICIGSLYGGSGIAVDDAIKPLHPCLIWLDRRANDEVEWVRSTLSMQRLEAITGNGVDSYYGFTKMLWVRNHLPEVWRKTRYFLPPNAFVIHALTGEIAVDRSSAGNIGGVYDTAAGTWSAEMLDALGIPQSMMPPRLVASSDVVGKLTTGVASRLGLAPGTPVVAGGVDAAVATLAAGVARPGQHVAMIGSSMCWGYISQNVDARHGLVSMPHVFGEARDRYVFGGAITAGASVSWFRDNFCRDDAAAAQRAGSNVDAALDAAARDIAPGCEGVLFLPYLMGERSPIWDSKASGVFAGLSLYHRREHLYRAVLEGVGFALRHNIDAGANATATLEQRLIVVGGAAHSDLWMQIIADITGRPVFTIVEEVEAAMGAALLAAYGAGLIDAAQVQRGWVTLAPRATPRPEAMRTYDALYATYKGCYPALKTTMHELRDQAEASRHPR